MKKKLHAVLLDGCSVTFPNGREKHDFELIVWKDTAPAVFTNKKVAAAWAKCLSRAHPNNTYSVMSYVPASDI